MIEILLLIIGFLIGLYYEKIEKFANGFSTLDKTPVLYQTNYPLFLVING